VEPYTKAVAALFDPEVSKADLISSEVSGSNSITLRWRLEGKLKIGGSCTAVMLMTEAMLPLCVLNSLYAVRLALGHTSTVSYTQPPH